LTPPSPIFSNPIPFIPFPLLRGRGISYIREASPLFNSPLVSLSFSGKERNPAFIILIKEQPVIRVFKRGVSPLFQSLPPLLIKERGTKGVRSPNKTL
jgi:hypothetical protein